MSSVLAKSVKDLSVVPDGLFKAGEVQNVERFSTLTANIRSVVDLGQEKSGEDH